MNSDHNFKAAQRSHDNQLPPEEKKRVCRCCGLWRWEHEFPSGDSHTCLECVEWAESQNQ